MGKLYTALNVNQYSEVLRIKELPLLVFDKSVFGLEFTEDKSFWIEQLKNQEDLENVADYKYSIIIEFEMDGTTLNSLIKSQITGRLSEEITKYYRKINKPITLPELKNGETNVLCILDVYQSDETEDGISQRWILQTDTKESELWKSFLNGISKISCLGAIPGAVEEAKFLLTKPKLH
jgi:hypothetical protein